MVGIAEHLRRLDLRLTAVPSSPSAGDKVPDAVSRPKSQNERNRQYFKHTNNLAFCMPANKTAVGISPYEAPLYGFMLRTRNAPMHPLPNAGLPRFPGPD